MKPKHGRYETNMAKKKAEEPKVEEKPMVEVVVETLVEREKSEQERSSYGQNP